MADPAPTTHRLDHKPFLVPPGKKMSLDDYDPRYSAGLKNKIEGKKALLEDRETLAAAQSLLWANGKHSVLIILRPSMQPGRMAPSSM